MSHDAIQQKPLKTLIQYWPIIVFIGGLIVTWTNFQNVNANSNQRLDSLENKMEIYATSQNAILVQLSQIQTDVLWIKAKFK